MTSALLSLPERSAPASLKQKAVARLTRQRALFTGAFCSGLIEASSYPGPGTSDTAAFTGAFCSGLIEAPTKAAPSARHKGLPERSAPASLKPLYRRQAAAQVIVYRSVLLRPH